jgi:site-specific recombinase XerD
MDNEKIDRNPAGRIRRKTEDNGRIRFLSKEEENKIRAVLAKDFPQHTPAFDLSLHTGMRATEQFSMKWNQIDWERRILSLPKTKNGHARHIPLNVIAFAALESLKKKNGRSPWLFLNRQERKLRGPRDWFEPAVEKARVDDYTWHCNRHTFASRLVMAGIDIRTVSQLMGHRTIQIDDALRTSCTGPSAERGGPLDSDSHGCEKANCHQNCHRNETDRVTISELGS